jgi:diguanylate cyclase (GGDEF)-like protein/PAS domain S-box-containing protein
MDESTVPRGLLEVDEEVSALIESLHRNVQRLEMLTAGEVDAVAGGVGGAFLLRGAQDHARRREAARQADLLNALPANVALLDAGGRILSVNDAWRGYGQARGSLDTSASIGLNYLDICDCTTGEAAGTASGVARGIRAVLAGALDSYSVEYPCHSETAQSWFLLTVSPVSAGHLGGAVVMHLNVTWRHEIEARLADSELRFRQMAESISDVFFLRDVATGRMLYVSPAYESIWGRPRPGPDANTRAWFDTVHPEDRAILQRVRRGALSTGTFEFVVRIIRPDGHVRWVEVRGFPVLEGGRLARVAGVAKDVTERRASDDRIRRLNRLYAMLSAINALIVRVGDRDELFTQACRIAVDAGGFAMACVGVVDPQGGSGKVVARHGGEASFVDGIELTAHEGTPWSERPASRALRLNQPVLCDDTMRELALSAAERVELRRRGHLSIGCFPLTASGRPDAVLLLFAGAVGVFDAEETALLKELAGDLCFALDHIEKKERLDYLAYYDAVTGLANRRLFFERVAQYTRSAAIEQHALAVYLIDLQRFKNINDSFGQPMGDSLLQQVAQWLTQRTGDANLLARVGADHFAVVLPRIAEPGDLRTMLEALVADLVAQTFHLGDSVLKIDVRVGAALFPADGNSAEALFRNAEAALKHAKAIGERVLLHTRAMTSTVAEKLTLETQLRQALEREEFVLHYQPKVNLVSGRLVGAEALIRWNDPCTGSLVPPGRFIPVLEETGLIHEVGRWALAQALADYRRWRDAGLPAVRIAVNVSPLQLRHRDFITDIEQAIGPAGQAADGLELEITESLIMADVTHSIATLTAIRAMGVTIAIDDFGTGFSSLSYLSKLPVDTLKIDRSFIVEMTAGRQGLALVSTIIDLARSFELKVVAEGVETEKQSRLLRLLRCDELQGWLFSKAVPAAEFEARFLTAAAEDAR